MMLDVTKYRYENFDFAASAAAALKVAQKEAQHAKELAEKIAAEVPPEPTYTLAELEAAKTTAFAEGKLAGAELLRSSHEEEQAKEAVRVESLLQKIDAQIAVAAKNAAAEHEKIAEKLKAVSYAAAKKVIGALPDAQLRQIENFIDGALGVVSEEQKVALVVAPEVAKQVRGKFATSLASLEIVEDAAISPNDLKIIWNNGFAERKLDELWKEIGQIVLGKFDIDEFAEKTAIVEAEENKQ